LFDWGQDASPTILTQSFIPKASQSHGLTISSKRNEINNKQTSGQNTSGEIDMKQINVRKKQRAGLRTRQKIVVSDADKPRRPTNLKVPERMLSGSPQHREASSVLWLVVAVESA
jgi:hypothetical protein